MALALGLLIARVVIGLTLAGHGVQKLFGWFGGPGLSKQISGLKAQGYKPAWLWAFFVCLGEVGGGLSLAFGLLTPLGAAGIVGAMFMAIVKVHWKNGFWNGKRGIEFPLALLAVAVEFGIAGPGDYSLDGLLKLNGRANFWRAGRRRDHRRCHRPADDPASRARAGICPRAYARARADRAARHLIARSPG
jgi:putative oxidoreductase